MFRINESERGSGKTSRIIEGMEENNNSICIIPKYMPKAIYPESVRSRVYTDKEINENVSLHGLFNVVDNVYIDECFRIDEQILYTLIYVAGKNGIKLVGEGTKIENS